MNYLTQIPMDESIDVRRGQTLLIAGTLGPVWRVNQGVFKLERPSLEGQTLVQLAMPGDLIGVEALCAAPYAFSVTALVSGKAQPQQIGHEAARHTTMAQGFLQQQRQTCDMHQLRTGPISRRLAFLLTVLGKQADGRVIELQRKQLPTLKEMARVVDSTFETVCRELNALVPERHEKPSSIATAWASVSPYAMAA